MKNMVPETGQLKPQRDFPVSRIQKRCSGRGKIGVSGISLQKTGENNVNYGEADYGARGSPAHPVR